MIKSVTFAIFMVIIVFVISKFTYGQFEDYQVDLDEAWFTEDLYNDPYFNNLSQTKNYGFIAPGTKWCGQGDKAESYDDLGKFNDTDICCRAHDNCPMIIKVGETCHGLTNPDASSRLSCDCDRDFYKCLKNNRNIVSKTIGTIYFDLLKKKCLACIAGDYHWAENEAYSEAKFILFIRNLLN
ncbi:phospholipase A2-like [Cotesia glomerata]|uniref:phospholipase A2-like n=1 Tax=Cotesia glomerata TaxID=32391 RepID=UPI001D015E4C|nr:phospholipase A2-like [Cotesia glomerata]